ncbi:MAG: sodium:proton antiporter [Candidatus Krumholzibacteriia bacterium]
MPSKRPPPRSVAAFLPLCFLVALLLEWSPAHASEATGAGEHLGSVLPVWSVVPFIGILLSIALFPLFAPHWWHRNFAKVSAFWAILFAAPFVVIHRGAATNEILHTYMLEYVPFIILLWALFTISGGILVRGTLRGTPGLNVTLLLVGTIIASWVGTTGASMILIRPLLRANEWRRHKVHTLVFFIFLVSNIGGSLTPLGDPPLFLGFLHGVPFFWTMHLLPALTFLSIPLLALYYFIDRRYYGKEEEPEHGEKVPLRVDGLHNVALLLGVVVAVLLSGVWHPGNADILGVHVGIGGMVRDGLLLVLGIVSWTVTKSDIHEANGFSWFPIKEVAFLFAGIFMTIIPAIAILKAGEDGGFAFIIRALETPRHYFWVTGTLSSFLDNAPSYLTLFNSSLGKFFTGVPVHESVHMLIEQREQFLGAISTGAVFFGALTYIGNAPNFMVKSIAEEAGVKMPSFFGYMLRYSIPVLIPLFFLLTLVLF